MKLVGIIGTVLLSLILVAPVYAQEQHDQEEQKDQAAKPGQDEKKAEPDKSAKQDEKGAQPDKNAKPEEKNAQQESTSKQEEKTTQQHTQPAKHAGIPADRYKANFGREHTFRVTQVDYNNHRFQYGGYWFGFAAPWPGNWLYTQNVFVVDIGGVYYLCNPTYPGVNVELSITL